MTLEEKSGHASLSPWRSKSLPIRNAILDILDTFDGSMSTRQVYYQCVSRLVVPNGEKAYDQVQRIVVRMRRLGEIPYNRIVDRSRRKYQRPGWDGVREILGACAAQYRRSIWTTQDTIAMVAVEKRALEGVFAQIVDEYGASLWVLGGYPSVTFLYDWAEEIRELNGAGKRVAIGYFGDCDPTGVDIDRAVIDGLSEHAADFEFTRWGIRYEDIVAFGVPALPVKASDTRSKKYLAKYGPDAAELDALPPDELRRRIRRFIDIHVDADAIERTRAVEEAERESLNLVAGNWMQAVRAAGGEA